MKRLGLFICFFLPFALSAQTNGDLLQEVREQWADFAKGEHQRVKEVLDFRSQVEKQIKKQDKQHSAALLENGCQALSRTGALYREGIVKEVNAGDIRRVLKGVPLDKQLSRLGTLSIIIDHYFALKEMKEGTPPAEAWGGMTFNTGMTSVGNARDYRKYRQVLELGEPELAEAYMRELTGVFRFNGYTKGLDELRPYLEKYLPEGELKEELRRCYERYACVKEGAPAPAFVLKDYKERTVRLSDYAGKVLVVDVWATWCGGCIANLPHFIEMSEKYKGRDDIEFITISIDDRRAYNTWKYSIPRHKLMGFTNLIALKDECDFLEKYMITGIPRYFIIDREGKIVTLFAPSPGAYFESLIENALGEGESNSSREHVEALQADQAVNPLSGVSDAYLVAPPESQRYSEEHVARFIAGVHHPEAAFLGEIISRWETLPVGEERREELRAKIEQMTLESLFQWYGKEGDPSRPERPDFSGIIRELDSSVFPFSPSKRKLLEVSQYVKEGNRVEMMTGIKILLKELDQLNGIVDWVVFGFLLNDLLNEADLAQSREMLPLLDQASTEFSSVNHVRMLSEIRRNFEGKIMMLEMEINIEIKVQVE